MLLDRHGQTYAAEARIRLTSDPTPSPLYRLLCLATLLSARVRADAAVEATRALSAAGWRTAGSMADSMWEQRVEVLNENGYARDDESTARMLGDTAQMLLDRWDGDLRCLRREADGDVEQVRDLLQDAKGIGDVGADIFCREVQGVWPEVRPFLDEKALGAADDLGLGRDRDGVAGLVPGDHLPELAAALVRAALAEDLDEIRARASER
ncbi:endonuclease [soil metagenome]